MSSAPPTLLEIEARLLGVLIEKALTTPDQYPLSFNSATAGCNQKSNRDPVTSYLQAEVEVAMGGLIQKHLAGRVLQAGSRVEKFRHSAHEGLGLPDGPLAVLAELLMRGPQSAGELRARVARMVEVPGLEDLYRLMEPLLSRGFVERLSPVPGTRAERYAQLLCPNSRPAPSAERTSAPAALPAPAAASGSSRGLEARVAELERAVGALQTRLDELAGPSS
jgi:uncharacterized protein YceH (UPF0502 family)